MRRLGVWLLILLALPLALAAQESAGESQAATERKVEAAINDLDAPLYSPFIERYLLDEVRQLRIDMERKHRELAEEMVDRELSAADKALSYSNTTVTYFFYLIAGLSSVLVLVGWNSIRDIKDKVHSVANEQVAELVEKYEDRLRKVESQLQQETELIESNRHQINLTQEVHSLWLRASQETAATGKIAIYDQIIALRPADVEAFTFKADAVLEQGEAQWAINLCHQALARDDRNGHAFYQLACAHTSLGQLDEGARYFVKAVEQSETYREGLERDEALAPLRNHKLVHELLEAAAFEEE